MIMFIKVVLFEFVVYFGIQINIGNSVTIRWYCYLAQYNRIVLMFVGCMGIKIDSTAELSYRVVIISFKETITTIQG